MPSQHLMFLLTGNPLSLACTLLIPAHPSGSRAPCWSPSQKHSFSYLLCELGKLLLLLLFEPHTSERYPKLSIWHSAQHTGNDQQVITAVIVVSYKVISIIAFSTISNYLFVEKIEPPHYTLLPNTFHAISPHTIFLEGKMKLMFTEQLLSQLIITSEMWFGRCRN